MDKPVFSSALRDDDLRYTRLAEVFLPRPSLFSGVYPLLSRDNQRQMVRHTHAQYLGDLAVGRNYADCPAAGRFALQFRHPGHLVRARWVLPRK